MAREVLSQCGTGGPQVAAIGITNQRETTILWDRKTGQPVYNAIVWQDRRTADDCETLRRQGYDELVYEKNPIVDRFLFCATKIRWLLNEVPGVRARAERGELAFGTVDSWLIWKATGGKVHATDVTNASRTMLMNIHECCWDDELLEMFDIPRELLPTIEASSHCFGETDSQSAGQVDHTGRCRRRPASRIVRPKLHRAWNGQEHLWHRMLPTDERRSRAAAIEEQIAHLGGLRRKRSAGLRVGGQHFCRWCGRAMASRWAGS